MHSIDTKSFIFLYFYFYIFILSHSLLLWVLYHFLIFIDKETSSNHKFSCSSFLPLLSFQLKRWHSTIIKSGLEYYKQPKTRFCFPWHCSGKATVRFHSLMCTYKLSLSFIQSSSANSLAELRLPGSHCSIFRIRRKNASLSLSSLRVVSLSSSGKWSFNKSLLRKSPRELYVKVSRFEPQMPNRQKV